jgi:hypothetical protein
MIAQSGSRQVPPGSQTWAAELEGLHLCVRPAPASSRGEFAGYVDERRVGLWDSPEVARIRVLELALLPPPNTTRWTPRRKAGIVAAVRIGLISLDEACRRYGLTNEEFAAWRRLLEKHGVAGLRQTRPRY